MSSYNRIYTVCKCGGEPKWTETVYGEDEKCYSQCKKCKRKIVDVYKVEYIGRAYDKE